MALNMPAPVGLLHDMVPVGIVAVPESVSVTVTLSAVATPTVPVGVLGVIAVDVVLTLGVNAEVVIPLEVWIESWL